MPGFNFSLSDQTANIDYAPYRDGPATGGWNLTYSGQASVPYTQGILGPGTSSHVTTFAGATASLNYTGHTAYVYGNATDASAYTVLCDGQPTGIKDGYLSGVLGCCANQTLGTGHQITLNTTSSSPLVLTGFMIATELGADSASILNSSIQAAPAGTARRSLDSPDSWYSPLASKFSSLLFPSSSNSHALAKRAGFGDGTWQTTGQWNINSDAGGGGGTNNTWYPRITTAAANSVLIMTIPKNTSFMWLEGSVDWNHGAFEVQAWPDGDQSKATVWDRSNGSSRWTSVGQVICFRQFDPKRSFEIAVTNIGPDPLSFWDIHSLNYVQTSDALQGNGTADGGNSTSPGSSSKSSSLSAGAIAGIVIGSVAVIAIALLAFFFLRQRKKARQMPYLEPGVADLGEDKEARPMPFEGEMAQRNGHAATQSLYASVPVLSPGLDSSGESQQNSRNSKGGLAAGYVASPSATSHGHAQMSTEPTASQMTSPPSSAGLPDEQVLVVPAAGNSGNLSEPPHSAGSQSAKTPRSPRAAPAAAPVLRQERDAGRVEPAEEVIPPEYNPAWAPSGSH